METWCDPNAVVCVQDGGVTLMLEAGRSQHSHGGMPGGGVVPVWKATDIKKKRERSFGQVRCTKQCSVVFFTADSVVA